MSKPKDTISNFWVSSVNKLLTNLKLETITPEEFNTVIVQNTEDILTITVICTGIPINGPTIETNKLHKLIVN